MYGRVWEVKGVDNTLGSMLRILVEEALISENDNLEKEIADYWKYNVRYTAITINNPLPIQIKEGQSIKLDVTTIPIGGAVEYSVSDSSIAIVKGDGIITGLKAGKATIICNIKDTNFTASVDTEIVAVPHYTDIVIQNTLPISLNAGQAVQVTAVTTPNGGDVVYTSSDDSVATVNSSGLITAVASGSASITVTIKDTTISKMVNINVDSQIQKSISLTASSTKMGTYSTSKITATTVPIGLPVKFVIDGSACKCTLTNVTGNSCTLKSDGDVGFVIVKAYLADDVNVSKSVRITIDSSIW